MRCSARRIRKSRVARCSRTTATAVVTPRANREVEDEKNWLLTFAPVLLPARLPVL